MPLMPSFHDTRFWYHAHVDGFAVLLTVLHFFNITLLQFGKRVFETRISSKQYHNNFFQRHFANPSAPRRAKNMPVICCKKKRKHSKYGAFLQYSPVINYGHICKAIDLQTEVQKVQRDKTQKLVNISKDCILRIAKPCVPRTRKSKLYRDTPRAVFQFLSCLAFTSFNVHEVRLTCQSHS